MSTPISAATSYCTPAQFINFLDATIIGDLANDSGVRLTEAQILTDPKVQAALDAASGEVEMAALVSERYLPSDLQALTGVMAVKLQELVAWLAIPKLVGRRNPAIEKYAEADNARSLLQALMEGVRIFGLVEVQKAGLPAILDEQSSTTRPLPSSPCRAGRFFGIRGKYMGTSCNCGNRGGL